MKREIILVVVVLLIAAVGFAQAYAKPCPRCGAENQEIAKFCKECGFDFSKAVEPEQSLTDAMEVLKRARAAYESGKWAEALGLYQRMEELRPGHPEAKDRIKECEGKVQEEQRRREEAAKAERERRQYEAWLAEMKKNREWALDEARYLMETQDHVGASRKALLALAGSWDWVEGRGVLREAFLKEMPGKCCDATGAFGQAEVTEAYRRELEKKAKEVCVEVALGLADEAERRGDRTKACSLHRQVLRWKPGDTRAEAGIKGCPREAGEEKVFWLPGGKQLTMVWIPSGSFQMGSPSSEASHDSDERQHRVTLSKGFWVGKYEVTQEQYEAVMGSSPSHLKGRKRPVEKVSWYDAVEFCNTLSRNEGLRPCYQITGTSVTWDHGGNGYRLPTEAEWEYACRAGTMGPFHTGSCLSTNEANYDGDYPYSGCSKGRDRKETWEAGSGKANAWGLYDMHGNVWEWCWDWYGDYPSRSVTDPIGPSSGSLRVSRGGSWRFYARLCRSASRGRGVPGRRYFNLGFRLLRKE